MFAWFDTAPLAQPSRSPPGASARRHGSHCQDSPPRYCRHDRGRPAPVLRLAALAEAELPTLKPYRPSNWCANLPVRSSVSWTWRMPPCRAHCRQHGAFGLRHPQVYWAHARAGERAGLHRRGSGQPPEALTPEAGLNARCSPSAAHAVLKMIVEDGVFHADPIPAMCFTCRATASHSSTSG